MGCGARAVSGGVRRAVGQANRGRCVGGAGIPGNLPNNGPRICPVRDDRRRGRVIAHGRTGGGPGRKPGAAADAFATRGASAGGPSGTGTAAGRLARRCVGPGGVLPRDRGDRGNTQDRGASAGGGSPRTPALCGPWGDARARGRANAHPEPRTLRRATRRGCYPRATAVYVHWGGQKCIEAD